MLLGRRTYELTRLPGAPPWPKGWRIIVFSRTLAPEEHPGVTAVEQVDIVEVLLVPSCWGRLRRGWTTPATAHYEVRQSRG